MPLSEALYGHYDALREDLLRTGAVTEMSESSQPITQFNNNNSLDWRGKDPGLVIFFRNVNVTTEFGRTIGWDIIAGRDFSRAYADSSSMILSEAAAKVTGIKNPVGEIMKFGGKSYTVIGVVKDMLTNSPYDPIEPAIFLGDGYMSVITIRMKAGLPLHNAMAAIEKVFKKYNPASPFIYVFNDDAYAKKFDGGGSHWESVCRIRRHGDIYILSRFIRTRIFRSRAAHQRNRCAQSTRRQFNFPLGNVVCTVCKTCTHLSLHRHSAFLLWNEQLAAKL